MTPKSAPTPGSFAWREMVEFRLKLGYGAEDIALFLHCKPERVREHVVDLRGAGKLAVWWPKAAVAAE